MDDTQAFYESLADDYDLLFADWEASIQWQRTVLAGLVGASPKHVLDVTCGMGTQAIGLALDGHTVVTRDLSPRLVERLEKQARRRSLSMECTVRDVREIDPADAGRPHGARARRHVPGLGARLRPAPR